jgi:hypothetical protein
MAKKKTIGAEWQKLRFSKIMNKIVTDALGYYNQKKINGTCNLPFPTSKVKIN